MTKSQYLKPFLGSAFVEDVSSCINTHDLPVNKCWDHEPHSLTFLYGTPQLLETLGLLQVASLSTAPLPTAPSGVSSRHSDTDKH